MRTGLLERLGLVSTIILGFAFIGSAITNNTQAAAIVVPNSLATQEGNSNNAVPFIFASRYQQVFGQSNFSLSGPGLITEISFRPDATFGTSFSATLSSVMLSLSTTLAAPDALNPMFSNNIGADATVVYNGPLNLSSSFTGPVSGPKSFDISIILQNPFSYDLTQGNLLLDVKNFANNPSVPVFDAENIVGDSISRVWNDIDVNSDMAFFGTGNPNDFSNSLGLVTQFTLATIAEPDSLALLSAAVLSMFFLRYKGLA